MQGRVACLAGCFHLRSGMSYHLRDDEGRHRRRDKILLCYGEYGIPELERLEESRWLWSSNCAKYQADALSQCFLSVPAIIYLVMVPMWSRTKKFANAYAFLGVDLLYTSKHWDKSRVIKADPT
jgi:hypothetical protein